MVWKSFLLAVALAVGVAGNSLAAERTVALAVDGMTCASCEIIVRMSLRRLDGVKKVTVSMEQNRATVTFDDAITEVAALVAATTGAGYPSRLLGEQTGHLERAGDRAQ